MANNLGHIYAPVSVVDVAKVLGVDSNDVGTLCTSPNINPYSLIQPLSPGHKDPGFLVSHMRDLKTNEDMPEWGDGYYWEQKCWQFFVPYVTSPTMVDTIRDVAWYRRTPMGEGDYKSLNHFDGYIHMAESSLNWHINDKLFTNDEIVASMYFTKAQEVVSKSGKANPGGLVGVKEVFGDEPFYLGIRIGYNNFRHYFISDRQITPDYEGMVIIHSGIKATTGTAYSVVPFVTNQPTYTTGSRFYTLKFHPNFVIKQSVVCREATVGFGISVMETDDMGQITKLRLDFFNNTRYDYTFTGIRYQGTEYGTTSDFPRETTGTITSQGERIEVKANSTLVVEKEIPNGGIRFWGGVASTYAIIYCTANATSDTGGQAYMLESNEVRMIKE